MNPVFPYWFAILLAGGTLTFYLFSALWNRSQIETPDERTAEEDFNLGLPDYGEKESLFAIALVAAGTSLSTVFVFFLTAGSLFGLWLLLCPVMFLAGNVLMFAVYRRIKAHGYFDEHPSGLIGASGLVPYLAVRLTGSRGVGYGVLLLSAINLIAVLVLELVVGVDVISYLVDKAAGTLVDSAVQFGMFAVAVSLLLGYVYVGGFRAVVASDVWQMKLMTVAVFFTAIGLGWTVLSSPHTGTSLSSLTGPAWGPMLWTFILNVVLGNMLVPMSQESSWQRFRAFSTGAAVNEQRALTKSLSRAAWLWFGLIFTSFLLLFALPPGAAGKLASMSGVLEEIRRIDDALFPLFLFPLMVVAGLSAMFSTADTCVSAILYLLEFPLTNTVAKRERPDGQKPRLRPTYRIAMGVLLLGSLSVYGFVRYWFNPTILQLVFSVFSNLVVIAPLIISVALLSPATENQGTLRRNWTIASLLMGFVCYWVMSISAIVKGQDYLWLSQLAILAGFIGAAFPMIPLWIGRTK